MRRGRMFQRVLSLTVMTMTGVWVLAAIAVVGVSAPAGASGDGHKDHHADHEHVNDRPSQPIRVDGGRTQTVTDATPTLSGTASPSEDDRKITVALKLKGKAVDGTRYRGVLCSDRTSSGSGAWDCTFTSPLESGKYRVHIRQCFEQYGKTKCGPTTVVRLRVVLSEPEPTEEPEPEPSVTPEPQVTPPKHPKPRVTDKPTAAPHKPAAPAVVLHQLGWKFALVDADGRPVGHRPLEPGMVLTLNASGLPAGGQVAVDLHSTPTRLGAAQVAADGNLVLTITVPERAPSGTHTVVATLKAPGYAASAARVTVVVAPLDLEGTLGAGPVAPPDEEPPTITDVGPAEPEEPVAAEDEGITLPSLFGLDLNPWRAGAAGGLAAAFVLLAALPAELLQSTLSENYGRAFGWLEPARRRVRTWSTHRPRVMTNPWVGSLIWVSIAAFILGFSEPNYGFNAASLQTFMALCISLFLLNVAVGSVKISVAKRRLSLHGTLTPLPGALVVAAMSVLISRVMDISPSLLFGLVVGVSFARANSIVIEGKLALVSAGSILGLGLLAWVGFSIVDSVFGYTQAFGPALLEETLAATALEALSVLLVGLLPFTYLEGKALHDWDQRVWAAAYFVAAGAFIFIAVPMGDSWASSTMPIGKWLLVCVGFAAISVTAWAVFRFMPSRAEQLEDANR